MPSDTDTAQVTPQEIVTLILAEMEAGMCPGYYSNLVPSVYHVYLNIEDLDRLRAIHQRIREEAVRALEEELARLNKAPKLKLPLTDAKKRKRYEALGDFTVEFHENTDEDARDNPLVIVSTFPVPSAPEDRVGMLTERVTKRRADGQTSSTTSTTTTQRGGPIDTKRAAGIVYANIAYEDDLGVHAYQMVKDLIKIGRGGADRWVDLKLTAKKDVSREHLQLRRDPASGQIFIKDLSSLGTTVNGRRIPSSIERVNGEEADKNIEVQLPAKARIGLAGVVFLDFRAIKEG